LDLCTASSEATECKLAYSPNDNEYWTAGSNESESVTVKFKERVKPQVIWILQPIDESKMAVKIKVYIAEDSFWLIDGDNNLLQAYNVEDPWQKFTFLETRPLTTLKIEVMNIQGGTAAQLKFKVFGIKCEMPMEVARLKDKVTSSHLGLRKFIPKIELFKCNEDLSLMINETAWVNCVELCPD